MTFGQFVKCIDEKCAIAIELHLEDYTVHEVYETYQDVPSFFNKLCLKDRFRVVHRGDLPTVYKNPPATGEDVIIVSLENKNLTTTRDGGWIDMSFAMLANNKKDNPNRNITNPSLMR